MKISKDTIAIIISIFALGFSIFTWYLNHLSDADIKLEFGKQLEFTINDENKKFVSVPVLISNKGALAGSIFYLQLKVESICGNEQHRFVYKGIKTKDTQSQYSSSNANTGFNPIGEIINVMGKANKSLFLEFELLDDKNDWIFSQNLYFLTYDVWTSSNLTPDKTFKDEWYINEYLANQLSLFKEKKKRRNTSSISFYIDNTIHQLTCMGQRKISSPKTHKVSIKFDKNNIYLRDIQ